MHACSPSYASWIQRLADYLSPGPRPGTVLSIYRRRKAKGIRLKEEKKKKIKLPKP
jgi:hypothetical protein